MSPVGTGEPACMTAPWKSPAGFPPFVSVCSDIEIPPALTPQLRLESISQGGQSMFKNDVQRYALWVAAECRNMLVNPAQSLTFCGEKQSRSDLSCTEREE